MDDQTATEQLVSGVLLVVGALTPIPAAIIAGATAIAGACGWIWGTKHEIKRARKKEEQDFIQNILDGKGESTDETT